MERWVWVTISFPSLRKKKGGKKAVFGVVWEKSTMQPQNAAPEGWDCTGMLKKINFWVMESQKKWGKTSRSIQSHHPQQGSVSLSATSTGIFNSGKGTPALPRDGNSRQELLPKSKDKRLFPFILPLIPWEQNQEKFPFVSSFSPGWSFLPPPNPSLDTPQPFGVPPGGQKCPPGLELSPPRATSGHIWAQPILTRRCCPWSWCGGTGGVCTSRPPRRSARGGKSQELSLESTKTASCRAGGHLWDLWDYFGMSPVLKQPWV